jgi:hypothetical protein
MALSAQDHATPSTQQLPTQQQHPFLYSAQGSLEGPSAQQPVVHLVPIARYALSPNHGARRPPVNQVLVEVLPHIALLHVNLHILQELLVQTQQLVVYYPTTQCTLAVNQACIEWVACDC